MKRHVFGSTLLALALGGAANPVGAAAQTDDIGNWATVRRLQAGTAVYVTQWGGKEVLVRIVKADGAGVSILDLSGERLSARAKEGLEQLGPAWDDVMDRRAVAVIDDVEFKLGGALYDGERQIGDLDHLVKQIARSSIAMITLTDNRRTRRTAIAAIACIPSALGFYNLMSLEARPEDVAGITVKALAVAIGPPLLTYAVSDRREVVYRAPRRTAASLDEATVRRVLAQLPGSLRPAAPNKPADVPWSR